MWLFAIALGAALMYMLDPAHGNKRRKKVMDSAGKVMNKTSQNAATVTQRAGGKAFGSLQEAVKVYAPDNPNPDDATLRDRVQSVVFRDPDTSRKQINVNVADGIVELRGELSDQAEIDALVKEVQGIANVRDVHNYLHLHGTPAPNKASALENS